MCLSRPLLNQYGEIGSGYPSNVYDGNRLLFPILREKMVLSDVHTVLIDCRMVVVMGSKYLEYNASIRTEKSTEQMINRTLNNRTKLIEQKKSRTN